MTAAYTARLLLLSLSVFFVVNAALGLGVWAATPVALRKAKRMTARSAARLLLWLRLLPFAGTAAVVAGLCVPSYVWFEPHDRAERIGLACVFLLAGGVWLLAAAAVRGISAMIRSAQFRRSCRRIGKSVVLEEETEAALVIETEAPILAVTGLFQPRLAISQGVLKCLSGAQLKAALCHERAHRTGRDNWKRLLLLVAPNAFPGARIFARIERDWVDFTEWAADDEATGGDAKSGVTLAGALVQFARMGTPGRVPSLSASFVPQPSALAARLNRLLDPEASKQRERRGSARVRVILAAFAFGAMFLAFGLRAETLASVHQMLEWLVR